VELSFSAVHEALNLPPGTDAWVWRHEPHGYIHPLHHHDEPEFNLVLRGTARYLLGDHRYDIGPGCLVWLFPAHEHILLDLSEDFACWIGVMDPRALRRGCPEPYRALLRRELPGPCTRRLAPVDAAWLDVVCADFAAAASGDAARVNAGAAWLFLSAWRRFVDAADRPGGVSVHPAVERAAARLAADPDADLASDARAAGLSHSRLSRLFHEQIGTTLVAYRARRRVDRFRDLRRRHPQRSLLTLALEAGFGSYAQFHRAFRAVTGVSPAHWRG
jgi:AraC-like DNA-binding protein/mannose-6-phosphate isomerase-like protein (cupin superfamily)